MVSCFKSSQELCYYFWAKETTARVLRVREEHSAYEDRDGDWRVTFKFRNAETDKMQRGFSVLDSESVKQYERNQQVEIEYYSDSLIASRLSGQSNRFWVKIFVGSMTLCIVSVSVLTWQGMLEEKRLDNRKWWIK